ncbi:MAG: type II secretion system F family protein [Candidatus Omnitrophota bacterium]|jgi:type II secretory pathway component PulF
MPQYHYKAKQQNAETVVGRVTADNREAAIEKVHQLGLVPVIVEEVSRVTANGRGRRRFGRVSSRERYLFSKQLVSLIKAGVPILRALEVVSQQTKQAYFRDVIESIHASVRGGMSLSDSFADYPRVFSSLYVNLIKAGEESGRLKEALTSITDYQRQQEAVASKIRAALAYPLLMLLFGIGSIIFTLTYVLPKITTLYDSFNQSLPAPTLVVMNASVFLLKYGVGLIVGILVIVFFFKQWIKTSAGKGWLSQASLAAPLWGEFALKVEIARFARALRLLIHSGVSVVRAFQFSIPVVDNTLIFAQLKKCQEELIAGHSFGETLRQSPVIPDMVGHLISVGEESGSLSDTLEDIADNYEQDTNETIKIMTTLLEPLLIVGVGAVLGFIVIAMLLPIFQLDVFAG